MSEEIRMQMSDEITLVLPEDGYAECGYIGVSIYVKSFCKNVTVINTGTGEEIGVIEKGETAYIKPVKPKWYQFISRLLGRKRWIIV